MSELQVQVQGQTNIYDFLGMNEPQARKVKTSRKPATSNITKETRKASYEKTKTQPLKEKVLKVLEGKKLTAREIALEMHSCGWLPYPARAIIQPRITELVEAGEIKVAEDKQDTLTHRKVAVYMLNESEA